MRLTRRDALAALAAAGIVGGGAGAVVVSDRDRDESDDEPTDGPVTGEQLTTLVAAAETLYPSAVENVEGFVGEFVRGRAREDPDHARGVASAVDYLNGWTHSWYDEEFAALGPGTREEALRRLGADTADPDPSGSNTERVRYYVVNELLFALYTTPTGGELVGVENPQGHPGGLDSYQRGPRA